MKKKTYLKPDMLVYEIQMTHILCGSDDYPDWVYAPAPTHHKEDEKLMA